MVPLCGTAVASMCKQPLKKCHHHTDETCKHSMELKFQTEHLSVQFFEIFLVHFLQGSETNTRLLSEMLGLFLVVNDVYGHETDVAAL